jgi:hypothetical protein
LNTVTALQIKSSRWFGFNEKTIDFNFSLQRKNILYSLSRSILLYSSSLQTNYDVGSNLSGDKHLNLTKYSKFIRKLLETFYSLQAEGLLARVAQRSPPACTLQRWPNTVQQSPAQQPAVAAQRRGPWPSTRRSRPFPRAQATTWAWAGNSPSRLGHNSAQSIMAIAFDPTAIHSSRPNKNEWPPALP